MEPLKENSRSPEREAIDNNYIYNYRRKTIGSLKDFMETYKKGGPKWR